MSRRTAFATTAVILSLTAASAAEAATTRYARPDGLIAGGCTSEAAACTLKRAVEVVSEDGDEVVLAAGDYEIANGQELTVVKRLDIRGAGATLNYNGASQALVIATGAEDSTVDGLRIATGVNDSIALTTAVPVRLSHIDIEASYLCAVLAAGATVEDSTFTAHGIAPCLLADRPDVTLRRITVGAPNLGLNQPALWFGGANSVMEDALVRGAGAGHGVVVNDEGGEIRRADIEGAESGIVTDNNTSATVVNSVVTQTAPNGSAVGAMASGSLTLRNVSAFTRGVGATAVSAGPGGSVDARNVIARGTLDLEVEGDGSIAIDHSSFATTSGPVTDRGDNQSTDPLFVNGGGGDLRLREGSPAIDAGVEDPLSAGVTLDGTPRVLGAAPDIGAYETAGPPKPAGPGGGQDVPAAGPGAAGQPGAGEQPGQQPQQVGAAPRDTAAPVVQRLAITNDVFAVGSTPTKVSVARAKIKRGTTFRYRLTEAAGVSVIIERKARKRRWAKKGTLKRTGTAGANAIAFSGRVGRRALKPGAYRARLVATDSAGNVSAETKVTFRVVEG